MDEDVVALATAMDDLASFLAAHGERRWARCVAKNAAFVRRGDGFGVTQFLTGFGTMGSLNDVVFMPENGNAASLADARALNPEFERLLNRAWRLATDLRHDAVPPRSSDSRQR